MEFLLPTYPFSSYLNIMKTRFNLKVINLRNGSANHNKFQFLLILKVIFQFRFFICPKISDWNWKKYF